MIPTSIIINRLRIMQRGRAAYDQHFHEGVNIIRGENSSGKTTIADCIFYILGGEFDDWKSAAQNCDEVQAEISTPNGLITLKREIGKKTTPITLFFGSMKQASERALEGWEQYNLRRQEKRESFSQILFRSTGIPEARSEGASNITMHQLLRLLYADQRTPSTRLFRFESFDTHEIREAVGDLICGINVYEYYEIQLELRTLGKLFDELSRQYTLLRAAIPNEDSLTNLENLNLRIEELRTEQESILNKIENVDEHVNITEVKNFSKGRKEALQEINKEKENLKCLEEKSSKILYEINDLNDFIAYLKELSAQLPKAQEAAGILGNIEFSHCPACLRKTPSLEDNKNCVLCGLETDPHQIESTYLQIKTDIEIQLRESKQLLYDKENQKAHIAVDFRKARRNHETLLSEFLINYDKSISPRESFLAEQNRRWGEIKREREYLSNLTDTVSKLQETSQKKAEVQDKIDSLKNRQGKLENQEDKRRRFALTNISSTAKALLKADLERQPEFRNPESVALKFRDDAIVVDGKINFAESSNVILKNTAILSLFSAACRDAKFNHPRFLLLDNVEDKGMEMERSFNFQKLIVAHSKQAVFTHQIIFTTSMINPELEIDEYVVGPHYTHEKRTLELA